MERHNSRRLLKPLIVIQLVVLWTTPNVMAQEEGVELAARAPSAFDDGDFREAAPIMYQAYNLLKPHIEDIPMVPILLYNTARAFNEDGRCAMASRYFTEFIDVYPEIDLDGFDEYEREQMVAAYTRSEQDGQVATQCAQEYEQLESLGRTAFEDGDFVNASNVLEQALNLSDEPETRVLYGRALFLSGADGCGVAVEYLTPQVSQPDITETQRTQMQSDLDGAAECHAEIITSILESQDEPTTTANQTEIDTGTTFVRFVHASPDAGSIDVWVGDEVLRSNFAYQEWSNWVEIPATELHVTARRGEGIELLDTFDFGPDDHYWVFLFGTMNTLAGENALSFVIAPETGFEDSNDEVWMRFANMVADGEALALSITTGGSLSMLFPYQGAGSISRFKFENGAGLDLLIC